MENFLSNAELGKIRSPRKSIFLYTIMAGRFLLKSVDKFFIYGRGYDKFFRNDEFKLIARLFGFLVHIILFFTIISLLFDILHWPGAELVVLASTIFLFILYTLMAVRFLLKNDEDNQIVRLFEFLVNIILLFAIISLLFNMQWPVVPVAVICTYTFLSILVLSQIPVLYDLILKKERKKSYIQVFKSIKGNTKILFVVLTVISLYFFAAHLGIAPKFYSDSKPSKYEELRNEAYSGIVDIKSKESKDKFYTYSNSYWNFLLNREKKKK